MEIQPFTKVLCQDCLRVREYTVERHHGIEMCECGGEFCGCPLCARTINELRAGKRKAEEIGCIQDVTDWSEEFGITTNSKLIRRNHV